MTNLEFLLAVRARIGSPEHWTRGSYARDRFGDSFIALTYRKLQRARCYCLAGAAMATAPATEFRQNMFAPQHRLAVLLGFSDRIDLHAWQDADERRHADILKRIDDAITALAPGEPA